MHLTDLQHVKIHSVKTLGLQWVQSKHAGSQKFLEISQPLNILIRYILAKKKEKECKII